MCDLELPLNFFLSLSFQVCGRRVSVRGVGSNAMPLLQVLCMVAFLFKLYTTICMFNHEYLTYLV